MAKNNRARTLLRDSVRKKDLTESLEGDEAAADHLGHAKMCPMCKEMTS